MKGLLRTWSWLSRLKDDGVLLYFAWKHPRTPSYIRALLVLLVAYVVSPIDFVPDYLPFLGIADDLAIIPAGILYVNQLLPPAVRNECIQESHKWRKRIPYVLAFIGILGITWIGLIVYGIGTLLFK